MKPGVDIDLVNQWFASIVPHNRALGLQALEAFDDGLLTKLPYDRRFVGNPETGVLHGGVITSFIDATAGASIMIAMGKPRRIATLDLRIDYLRPGTPEQDVLCRGTCYKLTRQIAFVRALAHHGDEADPIASATGTFMIFSNDKRSSAAIAAERRRSQGEQESS